MLHLQLLAGFYTFELSTPYLLISLLKVFMKAIRLQPNSGAVKYLNMAQLSSGEESISFYQKALEILLNEKAQMERNPQVYFPPIMFLFQKMHDLHNIT